MPFDLEGAIKKGGTYKGVVEYLSARMPEFNLKDARATALESGKTPDEADREIAEYLSGFDKPETIGPPIPKQQPSWIAKHPTLGKMFDLARTGMEEYGRPALEMGGMEGAKALALPTTAALSKTPGGLAAIPAVTAGLETAGYTAGSTLADFAEAGLSRLDDVGPKKKFPDISRFLENMRTGATLATGVPIVGATVGKGLQKIQAPFASKVTPEAEQLLRESEEIGVTPTAADVTKSRGVSLFAERMPDISFMATDIARDTTLQKQIEPFMKAREMLLEMQGPKEEIERLGHKIYNQVDEYLKTKKGLQGDTLNDVRSAVLAQFGKDMPLSELGLRGQALIKAQQHARESKMQSLYEAVGQHLPQGQFLSPIRSHQAKSIVDEIGEQNFKKLPGDLQKELTEAMEGGSSTWENLAFLKSRLGDLVRENRVPGTEKLTSLGRLYNKLYDGVLADMKNISSMHGGQAWQAFEFANTFAKENFYKYFGQKGRASQHIRKLMDTNPEKLIEQALHPNGVTDVQTLKDLVGPAAWRKDFEPAFVTYLMGSADATTGVWNPAYLKNQLARFGKHGEETIVNAIGRQRFDALKQVSENGIDLSSKALDIRMLEGFIQKHPSTLVQHLIGAPETKLSSATVEKNLDLLKNVVDPATFNQIKSEFIDKVAELSHVTGNVLPNKFASNFYKYEAVLKKFLDPDSFRYAEKMANVGKNLQTADRIAGNPSGTGQTVVTWGQFGLAVRDVYNLATEGDIPMVSPAVILGPMAIATLYRTPFAFKYLTKGLEMSAKTKEGAALAAKLGGILFSDRNMPQGKERDPLGIRGEVATEEE